jgi:hypothetical protein
MWLESQLAIDVVVFIISLDEVTIPQRFNNLAGVRRKY